MTKERKGKLSYSSKAHNWVKPTRMVMKRENIIHFKLPKGLQLNFFEQLFLLFQITMKGAQFTDDALMILLNNQIDVNDLR